MALVTASKAKPLLHEHGYRLPIENHNYSKIDIFFFLSFLFALLYELFMKLIQTSYVLNDLLCIKLKCATCC